MRKQTEIGTVVFRTAIAAEILFAARVMQVRFLKRLSGKTPPEQNSSGKKIGAESAVLHFVFFEVIVNKMQQSAKRIRSNKNILFEVFPLTAILAGSGKTMPFEKRRSRYKETAENKAEAYRVYVEHLFSACDAVDARIFSKGEETGVNYYGARYLDPKYSRWLSGDPALGDYIPKAPIDDEAKKHNENLPGMGGVFNVVNLHLYHYAGNNPVKYTDPMGMSAWEPTDTWDSSKEEAFREKFNKNVNNVADAAIKDNKTIDCADVALTALVDTAKEMGLRLTFDVWDSSKKKYVSHSSSDSKFKNKKEFLFFVKQNMGAITFLDDRTTKETTKLTIGDLVMFDLRGQSSNYQGHTVIMTGVVDMTNKIISTVQGHIVGVPTKENYKIGTPMYGTDPQYRRFRFDKLFR